jgi:hypothetical protein
MVDDTQEHCISGMGSRPDGPYRVRQGEIRDEVALSNLELEEKSAALLRLGLQRILSQV